MARALIDNCTDSADGISGSCVLVQRHDSWLGTTVLVNPTGPVNRARPAVLDAYRPCRGRRYGQKMPSPRGFVKHTSRDRTAFTSCTRARCQLPLRCPRATDGRSPRTHPLCDASGAARRRRPSLVSANSPARPSRRFFLPGSQETILVLRPNRPQLPVVLNRTTCDTVIESKLGLQRVSELSR